MPRKSDAKEKLIKTAARLFRERGYHAVGLTEILEESGAPKGSFYHHFPEGKDQLAEACLRFSGKRLEKTMDDLFNQVQDFETGVDVFTSNLAEWFAQSNYQAGCPIATVVLETTPRSERVLNVAKEVYGNWIKKIADYATRSGNYTEKEAHEKATAIFLTFEGAWITARVQQSKEPFYLAAKLCKAIHQEK